MPLRGERYPRRSDVPVRREVPGAAVDACAGEGQALLGPLRAEIPGPSHGVRPDGLVSATLLGGRRGGGFAWAFRSRLRSWLSLEPIHFAPRHGEEPVADLFAFDSSGVDELSQALGRQADFSCGLTEQHQLVFSHAVDSTTAAPSVYRKTLAMHQIIRYYCEDAKSFGMASGNVARPGASAPFSWVR